MPFQRTCIDCRQTDDVAVYTARSCGPGSSHSSSLHAGHRRRHGYASGAVRVGSVCLKSDKSEEEKPFVTSPEFTRIGTALRTGQR